MKDKTKVRIQLSTDLQIEGEMTPIELFQIVACLKTNFEPQVRLYDKEIGWTCWQPTGV